MDYAANQMGASNAYPAPTTKKHVPLDDVERFADAIEHATYNVETFCARFFGDQTCAQGAAVQGVPTGYNGHLSRLGRAIDELNTSVQRLSEIG
jgi:hypothetical protein